MMLPRSARRGAQMATRSAVTGMNEIAAAAAAVNGIGALEGTRMTATATVIATVIATATAIEIATEVVRGTVTVTVSDDKTH